MSKNYVVALPQFHIEAESAQEAAEQAVRVFMDFPSSRMCTTRKFGSEYAIEFNPDNHDKQEIVEKPGTVVIIGENDAEDHY